MIAVLIPVGPGEREVERLHALRAEIDRHERSSDLHLFVLDDAPRPRHLELDPRRASVVRSWVREHRRPDAFSAHVAGTLELMAQARRAGAELALKLDTDAAVIGPFIEALRTAFSDSSLGVVGSYDVTSSGKRRDWSMWPPRIDRADRRLVFRRAGRGVHVVRRSQRELARLRALRRTAYDAAPPGAHCLGGAYAVSGSFLGLAELDWRPWIGSGLGEDVVVGLLCSAAGLRMRSLTGAGELFALAWSGLPDRPDVLVARGHSFVHSVRCANSMSEASLRRQLQSAGGRS